MGTAVAKKEQPTAVQHRYTAKELAEQIRGHMYDALTHQAKYNNHRLQAGQKLLQLRERIKSGEEGNGIDWWPWCETNIERSRKDSEKLMKLAAADDPELAFDEERERVRIASAKSREKKKLNGGCATSNDEQAVAPIEADWEEEEPEVIDVVHD
jgi:hypothetical protein